MQKIFLTGAAGFIGSHVARALSQRSIPLCVIDCDHTTTSRKQRIEALKNEGIEVIELDLLNQVALCELAEQFQPTHIIHLAARSQVRESLQAPHDYLDANVKSFLNILELCRKQQLHLVYASSAAAIYPITSLYGATKRANEAMAEAYCHSHDLHAVGLRYFTVYGPWGRPDMAYFHFCEAVAQGVPITLFAEGEAARDLVYIDDVVRATLAALDCKQGHQIFEIGQGKAIAMRQVVNQLEQLLERPANVQLAPLPEWDVSRTCADPAKAAEQLGFTAVTGIETGLARFVRWWQMQQVVESAR